MQGFLRPFTSADVVIDSLSYPFAATVASVCGKIGMVNS